MEDDLTENFAALPDEPTTPETPTCPVCERLKEICEEVGEGKFCSELMDKLKKDEINGEQFIESLMKNEKVASQFLPPS